MTRRHRPEFQLAFYRFCSMLLPVFIGEKSKDFSPNKADDLAADALLLGGLARDDTPRGRHDCSAHPAEDARQAILASVDAAAGLRHALEVRDDALAARPVLELDDERVVALTGADRVAGDIALLLEEAGDLNLRPRGWHLGLLVQRLVGVTNARQHVCDRVGLHLARSYQLDFVMPGICPLCASSRRQIRHKPNFRYTARGRPQRRQREYCRTLKRGGRCCLLTRAFLATYWVSCSAKGRPRPRRSASACSSVLADVVIATSRPRIPAMSS